MEGGWWRHPGGFVKWVAALTAAKEKNQRCLADRVFNLGAAGNVCLRGVHLRFASGKTTDIGGPASARHQGLRSRSFVRHQRNDIFVTLILINVVPTSLWLTAVRVQHCEYRMA